MAIKKMFIAGAKCPKCEAQDKVCLFRDGDREWIECVACGHTEERPKEVTPKDPEEHHASKEEVGVVRLFPPKS